MPHIDFMPNDMQYVLPHPPPLRAINFKTAQQLVSKSQLLLDNKLFTCKI